MASSLNLGFSLWTDGMEWTSLLSRQLDGGTAVWDGNSSATAVNPLSGVFPGPGSPLKVTQQASPNMSVLVNAGYCAVAHLTQGHGIYIFGLLAQGTITVSANASGQTRIDLIIARVNDLGSPSSSCDIEIVAGTPGGGQPATPGTSLLLATITVANGASSITTANITDKRTFTVAPGGILPAATSAAPPAAPGQVVYDTTAGILKREASAQKFSLLLTVPGTYTWTRPANSTLPRVALVASGSGGGGYDGSNDQPASGGPGGEWAEEPEGSPVLSSLGIGDVLTIVVPAAGQGSGVGQANQTAGADATASAHAVVLVRAHAGPAGVNGPGQSVPGGTGSTATIHHDGGLGAAGTQDGAAGGGGGSGGPTAPGNPGQQSSGPFGGHGGIAVPDGGPGGTGGGPFADGQPPAFGPGGGGGGSPGADGTSGPAADGQAILEWTIQPAALTALATADTEISDVDTSTGTSGSSGLTPASGSSFGWGIGYGSTEFTGGGFFGFGSGFDADGITVPQIQVEFDADGQTDFQLDAKWGLVVAEAAVDSSSPSISSGRVRVFLMIDSTILDSVWLMCAASGGVTKAGDAGSFTCYTSASLGTTPAAGTHTATLAIQTRNTLSGQLSGAHIGNLASTSTSSHAFGSVPGGFTSALTAEHCYLRVAGILASAV